jgi:hypothetical protein
MTLYLSGTPLIWGDTLYGKFGERVWASGLEYIESVPIKYSDKFVCINIETI